MVFYLLLLSVGDDCYSVSLRDMAAGSAGFSRGGGGTTTLTAADCTVPARLKVGAASDFIVGLQGLQEITAYLGIKREASGAAVM
ncbi:hypothetical protein EON64_00960 [archaeon]|nr:MAG: hypothetical protein EON64_00960 [archaeon]